MELLVKPGFIDHTTDYIRVGDFFLLKLRSRETYVNMARSVAYSKIGARNGSKCAEVLRIGFSKSPAFVTYPESFGLRERSIDSLSADIEAGCRRFSDVLEAQIKSIFFRNTGNCWLNFWSSYPRPLVYFHDVQLILNHTELPDGSIGLSFGSVSQLFSIGRAGVNFPPLESAYDSAHQRDDNDGNGQPCYRPCGLRNRPIAGAFLALHCRRVGLATAA